MLLGKADTANDLGGGRAEFFLFCESLIAMFKDVHEIKISCVSSFPTHKNKMGRLGRTGRSISFPLLQNFPHTSAVLHRASEIPFEVTYFERIESLIFR